MFSNSNLKVEKEILLRLDQITDWRTRYSTHYLNLALLECRNRLSSSKLDWFQEENSIENYVLLIQNFISPPNDTRFRNVLKYSSKEENLKPNSEILITSEEGIKFRVKKKHIINLIYLIRDLIIDKSFLIYHRLQPGDTNFQHSKGENQNSERIKVLVFSYFLTLTDENEAEIIFF